MCSVRNMPRWPPASAPCAMMTSAPFSSSQVASRTMVADPITMQPAALTRAKKHRLRQAEVEADHFRLQLLYQTAHRGVEWSAVGGVDGRGGIKVQLAIIRR